VVTGGAGFIGSNLAEEPAKRGYYVVILDDLSTGKRDNIELLIKQENTEFIHGSVTDLLLLQNLFQGAHCVFHLAAVSSVPSSIEDPLTCHETNITGTLNVLLAARHTGVKKVICASSSAVYGDITTFPIKEDMAPNHQSPYAVTKYTGEYYCRVFDEVYGLPIVCLRYFNVYGPRQDPNSQYAAIIPKFIQRVLDSKSPIIFGDGEQTKDFVFIKDVVEANILIAESEATGILNIESSETVSVTQLAKVIVGLVGNSIKTIHEEPRLANLKHNLADISKARTFGYNPKWSLDKGLRETIGTLSMNYNLAYIIA